MGIITQEMKWREQLCKYALKEGVTLAARKYKTYRQFVYRQLSKYDGTLRSLSLKSTKPINHPNVHSKEEKDLVYKMIRSYKRYGQIGRAHV